MADVKIVVLYPRPTDIDAFEKLYAEEHVPMARKHLKGATRFVPAKFGASPAGVAPYHRIVEIYFPSLEALQQAALSPGGQETLAHAAKISTGGAPVVMIAEEDTAMF
ncbi:MAG TPA: EthD family reductase [Blastocatellia bacterium]|nr:EthD family reductase [Blastocatellia bacterium]